MRAIRLKRIGALCGRTNPTMGSFCLYEIITSSEDTDYQFVSGDVSAGAGNQHAF